MTDRLFTARELAEVLGLKPGTILDKWERHEIPGYKFGRAVRFDLDEVLADAYQARRGDGEKAAHELGVRALERVPSP